jgi:hypothetical protein
LIPRQTTRRVAGVIRQFGKLIRQSGVTAKVRSLHQRAAGQTALDTADPRVILPPSLALAADEC